jgi:ATP-dependent RNA helicase DeaD
VESFEDLGLSPALVEALAAEGAERPTPLQYGGIPIIRRGNNVVAHAGPGAGTLITYGTGLLDRIEPGAGRPRAIVVVPTAESARRLAESLARLAQATGHAVASLGAPWVLPERADVLFATPADFLTAARADVLDFDDVQALVVDSASLIQHTTGLQDLELLLEYLPRDGQRVVVSLPVTAEVSDFVGRHVKRAVHVPPQAVEPDENGPRRGDVRFRIVDEPKEEAALALAAELLQGTETRHMVLFCGSEDCAADVGDFLSLHGYQAGQPGEADVPVWLAVDELGSLPALEAGEQLAVVSYDVPAGPDSLDRRHGGGRGGIVLLLARELAHLRDVARRTGYKIAPQPPLPVRGLPGDLADTVEALERAIAEEDLAPYLLLIETVLSQHDPIELAAAALALYRRKAPLPARATAASTAARPTPARVRLFISLGERDQVGAKDLVGAITGEAAIDGAQIGRVDVKDSLSLVEVDESVAEKVIRALNGTTIRGRSVRVDYDRPRRGGPARPARGPGRRK